MASSKHSPLQVMHSTSRFESASSIAVLGAGSWGTALAILLARNGQHVRLWDIDQPLIEHMASKGVNTRYLPDIPLPSGIEYCVDLKEALKSIQDILIVVPSHAFSTLIETLAPYVTKDIRIVWATKGLDNTHHRFLHEIVKSQWGEDVPFAVLSGPSFAKEVACSQPTIVTLASNHTSLAKDWCARLVNDTFRVELSEDVLGVQLGGVVKNVIAIAVGVVAGLGYGINTQAALMTAGMREMRTLGHALGAKENTFTSMATLGDLILTCTDNQSRNRRFGMALAQGRSMKAAQSELGQVVEGVHNAITLYQLAQQHGVMMPVCQQVHTLVNGDCDPDAAFAAMFASL